MVQIFRKVLVGKHCFLNPRKTTASSADPKSLLALAELLAEASAVSLMCAIWASSH